MRKIRLKWHLFWSRWHYDMSIECFNEGNMQGSNHHRLYFLHHCTKYVRIGGKEEHVYEV